MEDCIESERAFIVSKDYEGVNFYAELYVKLAALLNDEKDIIANAANFAAFIFEHVADLNWAGFYFIREQEELVLGPFQGRVACVRIAMNRGVCGYAAALRKSVRVSDVHAFPDHIVCDVATRSEMVIPLIKDQKLYGVFDLDSPLLNRFTLEDQIGLEKLVHLYVSATEFLDESAHQHL